MYLAIDTSTATAGLALMGEDGSLHSEISWMAGRNHTAELYPALEHLLGQAGITSDGLTGLMVARGPGSFTGIRVGMSAAKGLSLAKDIPLAGVSTLEAAAYAFAWSGLPVWAVVDAGRGEVASALFQMRGTLWRRIAEEQITTIESLAERVSERAIICGEVPPRAEAYLVEHAAERAMLPSPFARFRRPGYLGHLGWQRLQRGDADDPATLAPLYLRRPAVLEEK